MSSQAPSQLSNPSPCDIPQGIVVLYDGVCPTCIEDRKRYQSWQRIKRQSANNEHLNIPKSERVYWLDLNQAAKVLAHFNISEKSAIAELHVIINRQIVVKELDAYILLFKQIPKFRLLAWFIGLPLIKPCLSKYYRYRVQKRLARTNRL